MPGAERACRLIGTNLSARRWPSAQDRASEIPWPSWPDYNGNSEVAGIVANYAMSPATAVQAGVFRSTIDTETDAANLYMGIDEAGRGTQIAIIDPPSIYQTTSGEARMSHDFGRDSKAHRIQFSLRGRHKRRVYDGSDEIDLGPVVLNEERDVPEAGKRVASGRHQRNRRCSASATASAPAGKCSRSVVSLTARQMPSATSRPSVTAVGPENPANTLWAKGA